MAGMDTKTILASAISMAAACAFAAIPLPEHPRPDWERPEWVNLNGEWDFAFAKDGKAPEKYDMKIVVPFGWGSPLSGVPDKGDTGCYRRSVKVPSEWKGKRVFLVIGASDHDTTVSFDGCMLGKHVGGYTPFEYELTELVKWDAEQAIDVKVWDPGAGEASKGHYLYGKQGYGNARGIWQTVYLEARGETYAEEARFTSNLEDGVVRADVLLAAPAKPGLVCTVELDGKKHSITVEPGQMIVTKDIKLENPRLWDLDSPNLYDVVVTLSPGGDAPADVVKTYFGFREVGVAENKATGAQYVTLNGKPVYLQLTLDQSYHPEGWYTFPTDEFMKNEILISKKLGLSGNRVHIKAEIPRKLYWADKLGLLIQADVPCAWGPATDEMFEEHWKCFRGMVKRDFNHPSIYQWTLFNETWGLFSDRLAADGKRNRRRDYDGPTRRAVAEAYMKAKFVDPTRIVEDNSPCNHDHVVTDVNTWHAYCPGYRWESTVADACSKTFPGSEWNYIGGFVQGSEPMMNSECGNVWGYSGSTGDCDFTWDYHMMINAFRRRLACSGWLYTEHHDVCNEWNGYVRFDRPPKHSGFEELFPGMTLADLHRPAYIPLDAELFRTFKPGERYNLPVDISLVTDKYVGRKLSVGWQLVYRDCEGDFCTTEQFRTAELGEAVEWQNGRLVELPVEMPAGTACGTVNVTLFADGKAIAKNFTCFRVKCENELDARPVAAEWSAGTTNVLDGLKFNGFGKGFFEYSLDVPAGEGKLVFRAEVSSKRINGKDKRISAGGQDMDYMLGGGLKDRSRNENSYPQTSDDTWEGDVKVVVDGKTLATVKLPDDPADSRGILSWGAQKRDGRLREAGSYGYFVEAAIPASAVKDGKVKVRLESDGKGLAVYGPNFGRYPFGPHLSRVAK